MYLGKIMKKSKNKPSRMTLDEIEALLNSDDEVAIDILPNGEVRTHPAKERTEPLKILTFREKLGGEYGQWMKA